MKRILFAIIAIVTATASLVTLAQNSKLPVHKVDFDHVKEVTESPSSKYYYPKLLQRFQNIRDTTMTLEDYRNFYYGQTFQEDYNPFRESRYCNVVETLYYKQPHTTAECDSIEKYAKLSLDDNIFDMNQMKFYIYVLKEKKKYHHAAVRQFKLDRLIATILSSGKGTKDEPWVVITPEHEYNIINFLDYVAVDHQDLGDGIEFIKVQPKEGKNTEGFYFDVSRMMEVAATKFPGN